MTQNATENAPALDPIAETILDLLAAAEPNISISPQEVAQAVADARRRSNDPPDLWRRYLPAVKQQALYLARAGKLIVMRKGKPADAETAKGVIRYKRPI
ncbi:MAG: DUF3253 domain-containing protein [Alphaproteobacteria bacterium]|nr:DUF3253 domain-containing protein [Alphaproteobacteria bacterium]